MISSVSFHELAEVELNEASHYYESEVAGLGVAFLAEVERAIKQMRDHPEAVPFILKFVRRKLLRRFPYSVMYSPLTTRLTSSHCKSKATTVLLASSQMNIRRPPRQTLIPIQ